MARVTYGDSITEFAGSIGGVTFLRNASGPIAKLRSNPPVNPSPDQSTYQTRMAMLVAFWPTLSQEDKNAWNVIGADRLHTTPWGETKTLSGFQWFLSCNLTRFLRYDTVLESPSGWVTMFPPDSFTLVATSTYLRAEWSPAYDPPYSLLAFITLPLRQSSIKLRRSLFFLHYQFDPGALTTYDFTSYFESLTNVTWSTFFANSNCSIIARLKTAYVIRGWTSSYISAIVKIG